MYVVVYIFSGASDDHGVRFDETAERIARDVGDRVSLRWSGRVTGDAGEQEAASKPLSEHVDAWRDSLEADGATAKHIDLATTRVRRLAALVLGAKVREIEPAKNAKRPEIAKAGASLARWASEARLSDLTVERVQRALATLKAEGRSSATCNHHRTAIRCFAKWCHDTRRIGEQILRGLKGYNAKADPRHHRRTISVDELRRLIAAAERGPRVLGVTGPIRALCYRLAVATGMRYSEIASVMPASIDREGPSIALEAARTKNGDPARLPLSRALADDLAAHAATLDAQAPMFRLPEDKGAELLRCDLKAAGIPYRDASGLFFDFHSLRCETATLADAAGISPRVVQRLMRHSTLELTDRYTRPRDADVHSAAAKLPDLKPDRQ